MTLTCNTWSSVSCTVPPLDRWVSVSPFPDVFWKRFHPWIGSNPYFQDLILRKKVIWGLFRFFDASTMKSNFLFRKLFKKVKNTLECQMCKLWTGTYSICDNVHNYLAFWALMRITNNLFKILESSNFFLLLISLKTCSRLSEMSFRNVEVFFSLFFGFVPSFLQL